MGATPAGAADLNSDTHGVVGVEQRPDPVVGEPSETEGAAFDAFDEVVDCYLESLALLWLGAGVSCRRHVADGSGDAVVAPVAEVLGEVFSEVVVVGFEVSSIPTLSHPRRRAPRNSNQSRRPCA